MQKLPLFFSILRTSFLANKQFAIVPATRITGEILQIFVKHGIITSTSLYGNNFKIILNHNYPLNSITYVGRKKKSLWKPASYYHKAKVPFAIISTTKGILTIEDTRNLNLGGILICKCAFNLV